MKKIILLILLIIMLPMPAMPQKSGAKSAPKSGEVWREFVSEEGNFAVMLPTMPNDERTEKDLRYRLNLGPRVYGVARLTEFERSETLERTFNSLAEGFLKSSNGELITKTGFNVSGYPGLSIKFKTPDPPGITTVNYVLVKQYMYVLIAFTRDGNTEENADRFLKSFRLLKK